MNIPVKTLTLPVLAVWLALSPAFTHADGDRRGPRPDFSQFLTRSPLYVALDLDKDGTLSAGEIARAAESLVRLDANHDGAISTDEIRPSFSGRGGQRDRGPRSEPSSRNEPQTGAAKEPAAPVSPQPVAPAAAPNGMADRLMAYDKNQDGKVAKDEVPERMASLIAKADTDGDGAATRAEFEKTYGAAAPAPAPETQARAEPGKKGHHHHDDDDDDDDEDDDDDG